MHDPAEIDRPGLEEMDRSSSPIVALARTIEAKDPFTAGHTWRVSNYGRILARALGYSPPHVAEMSMAGYLHDIGKIAVPDEILTKPAPLSEAERTVMQRHPRDGYDFLRFDCDLMGTLDVVLMHHEAFDGSGYPVGLAGESIPPSARLFAVVDAFDAMTSSRPYRAGLPLAEALHEMQRRRGQQFDPAMAEAFVRLLERGLFDDIMGHSDVGVRIGLCPQCGPVIDVRANHRPGDLLACRVCAAAFRITAINAGHAQLEPVDPAD